MDADAVKNSVEQNEKTEEQKLAEKRAKKRAIQKRWRQRTKLKVRVAEFIKSLHMNKARTFERGELSAINQELFKAIKLPRCWNDKDLLRANVAVSGLEKKYLDRGYVKLNKDEADMTDFIKNTLDDSKLTKAAKVNVVLNLLNDVGRDYILEAGDGLTPSPDAALLLLTQNTGGTLPKWFADSLADLVEAHFTRIDIKKFLNGMYDILKIRDNKKYSAADNEKMEAEENEKMAKTGAVDTSAFFSSIGAKMKKR